MEQTRAISGCYSQLDVLICAIGPYPDSISGTESTFGFFHSQGLLQPIFNDQSQGLQSVKNLLIYVQSKL